MNTFNNNVRELLLNRVGKNFDKIDLEMLAEYKAAIASNSYFNFIINDTNGGFFFDYSLQFYSFSKLEDFQNIDLFNKYLLKEFGDCFNKIVSIGQDIFGNQFVYDKNDESFYFFNIETTEKQYIASDFISFINQLLAEIDYFSGRVFKIRYAKKIKPNERLCPKIPFTIGGEYSNANFYTSPFPDYIITFSDIARQIKSLPDGTSVNLKIK